MLATLRQRDFSLLWFAGLISMIGNWMLSVALPVAVYQMTESTVAVGGMLLSRAVPAILLSSVAGVYIDRWERRRTMVMINLLLAVSILPLLLVRSPEWLWLIYIVSAAQSTLGQFFGPAENAMLPLLSRPELLVSANALNALNNNLARLIGPAVGGLVAPFLGLGGVVAVDVVTYLAAALLTALISITSHPGKKKTDTDAPRTLSSEVRNLFHEWAEGMRFIRKDRTVRILFLLQSIPSIGESVMSVLFVPFVTEVLRGGTEHVGGLMSSQAVGGIIGGTLISMIAAQVKTARLLGWSAILFALADFGLFNYFHFYSGILLAYGFIMLAGPLAVGMGASYNTLIQENVADSHRGRIFGAFGLTSAVFTLVGIAIGSFGGDALGIVPMINIQVYGYALVGLICLIAFREGVVHRSSLAAEARTLPVTGNLEGAMAEQMD
jgi:MFS family permease